MITQIPVFHVSFQLLFCVLAFFFLFYDSVLLMATISHKNDPNVPFPYIVVMCVTGIVCKIAFITDFVTYLVLPYPTYFHSYRNLLGREFTLMGTLTYFIPLCVSALMTLNRLFLVVRPTNTHVFGRNRIFLYSFGILVLCLTLLLIPYFSYCPVNFLASTLVFVTGCAPERHPVTRFTNLNAIWVPITILVINSALVVYLKTTRVIQKTSIGSLTVSFVQSQKKREHMLTRQTVALAIYLSFYEVGSFLMRTFPEPYASLPYYVKDGYFYFRLETICAINFFVYFMENSSTRKMVRKFFGNRSRKESTITYGGRTSGAHKISVVSHNLMF